MKQFQLLMAALLLVFAGSTFGGDVQVITPDIGDTVNYKTFTVVGKAANYAEGETLTVRVRVSDGFSVYESSVYPGGTANSERIEIIVPKPSTVNYTSGRSFPIVAKITGFSPNENLTIQLEVSDGFGQTGSSTQVNTK